MVMTSSADPQRTGLESHTFAQPAPADPAVAPTGPPELEAAVMAGDWSRVAEIVNADWVSLLIEHRSTLYWAFRLLPPNAAEAHVLLKVGRDLLLLGPTGLIPDARSVVEPEEFAAFGRSPEAMQIITMVTARAIVPRLGGFFQAGCAFVDQASAIAAEAGRVQADQLLGMLPSCQLMWGITRQLAGDLPGSLIELK